VEFVDWVFGEDFYGDDDGNTYWSGNVLTWTLEGDLEGTYVQTITYVYPADESGAYGIVGSCTFEGTILGAKTSWTANVQGSGLMDLSDPEHHPFKGGDSWISTLTSSASPLSHMRGDIRMEGFFDEPYYSIYTYTGTLVWQTGKKN
jgi:hypothetical protein